MKNRIRELRIGHGVTQSALAKYLGIAQNTLSYWERGQYDVDNASLQKIADFFNCSVDCVLCRTEVPKSEPNEDVFGELLSDYEKKIILAFRKHTEMQEAVCKILGVSYIKPVDGLTRPIDGIVEDALSEIDERETFIGKALSDAK